MKPIGTLLAIFVGITLTVGVYEGTRLVRNTVRALEAASVEGKAKAGRHGAEALATSRRGDRSSESRKKRSKERVEGPPRATGTADGNPHRLELRAKEKLKRALLQNLSPEDRRALRESARDQRQRRKAGRERLKEGASDQAPSAPDAPIEAESDELLDEIPLDTGL